MAVQSITEAIDNFYTATWVNMKSEVEDQIFEATPFWFWMKENNGLDSLEGGRYIPEKLSYAKSDRVQFIGRGSSMEMSENEFLTEAIFNWKYLADSVIRYGVDDQQNRGKAKMVDVAKAKLAQSQDSLTDKMEESLLATNTSDSLNFDGLQDLVPDDPTASVEVGGINQNTYTWWRSQSTDMTGQSFSVYGQARMRTMMNNCSKGKASGRTNLILTGQTPYEYYEDSVQEQKRIVNSKLGDAGFENIQYKGVPMIWTPQSAANTRMYFLNVGKHLKFRYDPMMFFDMTEWKPIPDQVNDRVAQIILAGNLTTNRRASLGVIHSIDTE